MQAVDWKSIKPLTLSNNNWIPSCIKPYLITEHNSQAIRIITTPFFQTVLNKDKNKKMDLKNIQILCKAPLYLLHMFQDAISLTGIVQAGLVFMVIFQDFMIYNPCFWVTSYPKTYLHESIENYNSRRCNLYTGMMITACTQCIQ